MTQPFRLSAGPRPSRRSVRPRLRVEPLEGRAVPAVFVVTDSGDSGPGTLRDAIDQANALNGSNRIVFDTAGAFAGPQTIKLESPLGLTGARFADLSIDGPGPDRLVVERDPNAAKNFGIFGTDLRYAAFEGMTITGGNEGPGSLGRGSAMTIGGPDQGSTGYDVLIRNCVITGNTNGGGALWIEDPNGMVTIESTTISNNTGLTGAIYGYTGSGLTIQDSTISGNVGTGTAGNCAGGLAISGEQGRNFFIRNTTFANNSTANPHAAGGISFYEAGQTGSVTIAFSNCTITGNSAPVNATGGGGFSVYGGSVELTIDSTVIAGNSGPPATPDIGIVGPFNVVGGNDNVFGVDPGAGGFSNSRSGTPASPLDPKLGPLQDNGGSTETQVPLPGSPLIDTGTNPAGLTHDQRGWMRSYGAGPDVGAAEAQPPPAVPTITLDPAQPALARARSPVVFDVTFDQPVTGFTAAEIDLSGSSVGGLSAAVAGSGANYTVTVTGAAADGLVVASVVTGTGTQGLNGNGQNNAASVAPAAVVLDATPPTVAVNQAAGQPDPTDVTPLAFAVQFDEAVVGFGPGQVTLGGSLAAFASVQSVTPGAAPNSYVVDVAVAGTHAGTVTPAVVAGAVTDLAGNPNAASTSTDGTVTFDDVPPTVTVGPAAGQGNPAGGPAVSFLVSFDEPVRSLTVADLHFTGPPGTAAAVAGPAAGTNDYTVTFTGMTADGDISLAIDPGAVADLAGNPNAGSNTQTITYVLSGTVQFQAPTYTVNEQGGTTLHLTVTRTGGTSGALNATYATADGTGPTAATTGVDYTTSSGSVHWDAGDATPKTIDVPILDYDEAAGGFKPDANFTVGLTGTDLPGALGAAPTAAVTILEEAGLQFAAAVFDTAEGAGAATVSVRRAFDTHGALSVNYATSDGTATAGSDYTATGGTLTWGDGDGADKTFTVPITDDTVNEGRETIHLALSGVTGNAQLGPQSAADLVIAPSDGVTIRGTDAVPKSTFADADGDQVTIALGGKGGSLTYYLTDGAGPISEIDLAGTDPTQTTVTITVKKPKGGTGDGRVQLGEVDGTGFKSFTAKTGDLTGAGFNLTGYAGAIRIENVLNGADFELAGPPPPKAKGTTITAGVIGDGTDINVNTPLASLTAIAVGKGTIEAPSVGAIKVKGQKATKTLPAVAGDFRSDVTISGSGVDPRKNALGAVSVAKGAIRDAVISVGGNIGSVTALAFDGSELLAGFAGTVTPGAAVPVAGGFNLPGTVGSVNVTGPANAFRKSFLVGAAFKSVTLASAETAFGAPFGVFAETSAKVKLTSAKKMVTVLGGTQVLQGDLTVEIL